MRFMLLDSSVAVGPLASAGIANATRYDTAHCITANSACRTWCKYHISMPIVAAGTMSTEHIQRSIIASLVCVCILWLSRYRSVVLPKETVKIDGAVG